jgi:hypothetical protein
MAEAEHAVLAPSSAYQWVNCPGSVMMQRQYPEPEGENEAADEGSAAHFLASEYLKTGKWKEGGFNGVPFTTEMQQHVKLFTDLADGARSSGANWYVEAKVDISSIHQDCWGTADFFTIDLAAKTVCLLDLKYGFGIVEAFENPQLLAYASGIYDLIGSDAIDYTFELGIVQPRPWHREGPVRRWRIAGVEVSNRARHTRAAAEEALGNNPRTVPGPWCKHCTARHACPALRATTLDTADMVREATPVELPPEGLAVELGLLKRAQAQIEMRLAGLEAQATALIQGGKSVPGWGIDHTVGREEWAKPVKEVLALGDLFGVNLAKPVEPITPAQARKAGVEPTVIAAYAKRKAGTAKLVKIDTAAARKAFGG